MAQMETFVVLLWEESKVSGEYPSAPSGNNIPSEVQTLGFKPREVAEVNNCQHFCLQPDYDNNNPYNNNNNMGLIIPWLFSWKKRTCFTKQSYVSRCPEDMEQNAEILGYLCIH